jgi:hypothetical protein
MTAATSPIPAAVLFAPVVRDPVAGPKALIAEADSGVRRCDPQYGPALPRVIPTISTSCAPRGPLRR